MLISILLIITVLSLLFAAYVWWKHRLSFRERFAFAASSSLFWLTLFVLTSLSNQMAPWDTLLSFIAQFTGVSYTPPLYRAADGILSVILVVIFGWVVLKLHEQWDGKKSVKQHEREQARQPMTFVVLVEETGLQIRHLFHPSKQILKEYTEENDNSSEILQGAKADLIWHQQARELWQLQNRSYVFDLDTDWHDEYRCWIGKHKKTGETVILACWQDKLNDKQLEQLLDYVARVQASSVKPKIIIALKHGKSNKNRQFKKHQVHYISETVLLDKLIDFSDYFQDIRYQVEQKHLAESDLTIQQTYTPSYYKLQKHDKPLPDNVETFINQWLDENTLRQLALLGEYGQGKSTGTLMLSYHLIEQLEEVETVRIPILLELRGKSPRTLTPEGLLALWAQPYGINPNALMKLLIAGRLFLIFEGFDEMDLAGDSESRINHFRVLWKFAYPQAKLLITGRPNFFLDDAELKAALGIQTPKHEHPHCQAVYLAPFNVKQIAESLRSADQKISKEVVELAEKDNKFREIVGRPCLLHIVSTLWQRENLAAHKERINSALVMDLFIRHSYRRQGAKDEEQKKPDFMALNSAERAYFMEGITVYMAVNNLPNQISSSELDEVVRVLIKAMPDVVSKSVNVVKNETRKPLKQRFDFQNQEKEAIEHIKTDVRSCGLLVTDLSKANSLKFGHKSFMEFLTAKVFAQWLVKHELEEDKKFATVSIVNTLKLRKWQVIRKKESREFLLELLSQHVKEQGIVEKLQIAKGLFNSIFETDTLVRKMVALSVKIVLPLTGWLVQHLGEIKTITLLKLVVLLFMSCAGIVAFTIIGSLVGVAGIIFGYLAFILAGSGYMTFTRTFYGDIAFSIMKTVDEFISYRSYRSFESEIVTSLTIGVIPLIFFWHELGLTYSFLILTLILFIGFLINFTIGLSLGLLVGKLDKYHDFWVNLELWYHACRVSNLDDETIAKVIGKNGMVLLEDNYMNKNSQN